MATISTDIASRLDIICRRGDSFELNLEFGTTMPSHAAVPTPGSKEGTYLMKVATSDTVAPESLTFTYVSSDGVASKSKLKITATSTDMAAITPGLFVYDLQVVDTDGTRFSDGDTKTLLYGTFKVNDDIGV